MSEDELRTFLAEQQTVTCATMGPNARPHLMPLWYVPDGLELRAWTFAKSQKARNLERDPRATLQIEAGTEYSELRGAMLECDVELDHEEHRVSDVGLEVMRRYAGDQTVDADLEPAVRAQAPKRVALRFVPTRIVTWDHRKLANTY